MPPASGSRLSEISGKEKRGGDADVAGERQLEAGADGIAIERANDGLRQCGEAAEGIWRDAAGAEGRYRVGCLAEQGVPVPALGEDLAFGGEDGHMDGVIVGDHVAGLGELVHEVGVQGIPLLGAMKCQTRDCVAGFERDGCFAHGRPKL